MSDTVNWAGRTFGELTAAEQREVTRAAAAKLQAELSRPEVVAAILGDGDDNDWSYGDSGDGPLPSTRF